MIIKIATKEHEAMRYEMQLHSPPERPHWSESVDWPADRWDPLINAPQLGYPIMHVRGRTADGKIVEPMHKANGDGDGLMPPFDGWFVPVRNSRGKLLMYQQVSPVEWQPLRAGRSASQEEDPRAAAVAESYGYVTHGG